MGLSWHAIGCYWSIILSLVFAMSCNSTSTINVAVVPVEPTDVLDPSHLVASNKYVILDNLLGKLVNINNLGDYEFMIAKDIKASDDFKVFDIYIKHNLMFSDGTQLTSHDVARSLKRLLVKGSLHIPFKSFIDKKVELKDVNDQSEYIKVVNDRALRIVFDKPCKEFIYYMSLADAGILNEKTALKDEILAKDLSITSGAYHIQGNILVKNETFVFYKKSSPDRVVLASPKDAVKINYFDYDIGFSFSFDKNDPQFWNLKDGYQYATSNYQIHAFLLLNTDIPKFKSLKTRQKISRQIQKNYTVDTNPFFKKSSQFFIPNAFAFQQSFDSINHLPTFDNDQNVDLPSFTISAQIIAQNFVPKNFATQISKSLGKDIKVEFSDKGSEYADRKKKRDFESYLVITSMSYRVLTESLNLLYLSPNSFAKNPSGKIIDLITQFHSKYNSTSDQTIEQIAKEIANEAEIIPLNYVSSPIFFNSRTLDVSDLNTTESLTFWKLNVK